MGNIYGRSTTTVLVVILILCVLAGVGWYFIMPESAKDYIAGSFVAIGQRLGIGSAGPATTPTTAAPAPTPGVAVPKPELPLQPAPGEAVAPQTEAAAPEQTCTPVSPSGLEDGKPESVLKACVEKLKENDVIGAEQYVTENGMKFTVGSTVGIHEVLWKGLFKLHAYDEIGYDRTSVAGQTAWIPIYTRLGQTRMVTMLVMANRGDGWKLDHLCDAKKF